MAKAFLNVILKFIVFVVNAVLSPINLLIATLFPDFSTLISRWNFILDNLSVSAARFIMGILNNFPHTKQAIILYLTFLVSYYTISISVHAVLKVWTIIKRIKIW